MLWAKKLEECQAALGGALKKFLAPRLRDVKAEDVAADLVKTAVKVDMSRSATRLRRRLYASWGKYDLCEGELVRLSVQGLEVRPDLLQRDPDEVGDLHVDPFRVLSVTRMLGLGGKTRLGHQDRVKAVHLVLSTLIGRTRSRLPPLTERTVAVLMAMHAVEASHEVPKLTLHAQANRFFGQWELAAISEVDLGRELDTLQRHGAVASADARWKLSERLSYPW
jgi:hypothetical protein